MLIKGMGRIRFLNRRKHIQTNTHIHTLYALPPIYGETCFLYIVWKYFIFVPSNAKVFQRGSELQIWTVESMLGWTQMLTDGRTNGYGWKTGSLYHPMPEACMTWKLWAWHEQVSLTPMHKLYVRTVTSIFDLVTWFWLLTHCLVVMIISVKFIFKTAMHDKVKDWTRFWKAQTLSADFDLDAWFLQAIHLVMIIICTK